MSRHRCHARGCTQTVPHDKLMCLRHWRMVPKQLQDDVWAAWSRDRGTSRAWLEAAHAAIAAVAACEAEQGKAP